MKMTLAVGLLAVAIVWSVCLSAFRYMRADLWQNAYNVSAQFSAIAAKTTSSHLEEAETLLRYLKRSFETNGEIPPSHTTVSSHEAVCYIYRMDANGCIEHSLADDYLYMPHYLYHQKNTFDGAYTNIYVGNTIWDVGLSCWVLPVSLPIVSPSGEFDGILIALLDVNVLNREYNFLGAPPETKITLVGTDFHIRAANSFANDLLAGTAEENIFEYFSTDETEFVAFANKDNGVKTVTSAHIIPRYSLVVRLDTPQSQLVTNEMEILLSAVAIAFFVSLILLVATDAALRGMHIRHIANEALEKNRDILKATVAERTKELQESNDRLKHLAYYEPDTNLPNRAHLEDWLTEEIAKAKENKSGGSLIALSIDDLRVIGDAFGRWASDDVIKKSAERLKSLVPAGGFLAHLNSGEFYLAIPGLYDRDILSAQLAKLCHDMLYDETCGDLTVPVTATLGGAIYPIDGDTPLSIVQSADSAMLFAKNRAKGTWNAFSKEMLDSLYDTVALTHEMKNAINNGEFNLIYQPQIDALSRKTVGFEALIRWNNPKRGFVSPDRFIPLAENNGLIQPIGKWVFSDACHFINTLAQKGHHDIRVSINVSARQFASSDFLSSVAKIIEEQGINPGQIEIEVTETMLMVSLEASIKKLTSIQESGIKIALDDFGTGYSSLNYLLQLPFDTLKIDKSFVDAIPADARGVELVKSIILIARTLNKNTIVEGVETKEQLDCLTEIGCDIIQGYYFSRPLVEEEALAFLEKQKLS